MTDSHKSTRLGDLLIDQGIISREQLRKAIVIQQERRLRELRNKELTVEKKELGEILIELGFIDRRQLHFSLGWQRRLRKTTAVMVFVAPLLTAACGGGNGEAKEKLVSQESELVTSSSSKSSSSVAVSSIKSSSSVGVSSSKSSSSVALSSVKSSALSSVSSSMVAMSSVPSMQSSSAASSVPTSLDGAVQLLWTTPSLRENGEALDVTEIGGYELRYKLKSDTEYTTIKIEDGYADSYFIDHLEGDYEFEIATYDINGLYSDFVAIKPS